jgi:hypothetical protein
VELHGISLGAYPLDGEFPPSGFRVDGVEVGDVGGHFAGHPDRLIGEVTGDDFLAEVGGLPFSPGHHGGLVVFLDPAFARTAFVVGVGEDFAEIEATG